MKQSDGVVYRWEIDKKHLNKTEEQRVFFGRDDT